MKDPARIRDMIQRGRRRYDERSASDRYADWARAANDTGDTNDTRREKEAA